MKCPKGFRGKYFSLAAILALSTTVSLANEVQSFVDSKKNVQTQEEYDEKEELTPSAEELDVAIISKKIKVKKEKVYSASKNNISATNVTDNVSILTSEEIQLQGLTTLQDALKSLPSISVTSNGGLGQTASVFVQGFSNQYLLVLVDGVRYNDPSNTSGVRLDTLLVNDIDKIEVIKGAQSGVWGADAAAGVVNIITRKAKAGTHGSIGVEAGSFNTKTLSSSLSHKTKTYDVMLSYLRTTTDGFSAIAPLGEDIDNYEDDAYRNTTVNINGGYWVNANNRIELGYHDINSHSEFDGSNPITFLPDPNSYKASDYKGQSGYLRYKHHKGRHLIEASATQNKFEYKDLTASSGINDSIGMTPSFELKDTYKYTKNGLFVFGGFLEERKVKYTQFGFNEKEKNDKNRAIFANNTFTYDNFVFSQALRYDYFSAFKNKLTGKLGVKYNFSEELNIYANYGTAYKTPNIMDMINIWGLSNYNLKPENIKSFNMGIQYQGLHVNYFQNKIQDMIAWQSGANWWDPGQNVNIDGTSILKGVEISYQQLFFEKLLLGTNYTYVDAKDKNGERLLKRPRYQVGMNLAYSPIQKLTLSINGEYIGSRKAYGGYETGRYFVADSKIDYKINNILSTYLKVDNIFDRKYQTTYGYATPRRSFYVGLKAKF